MTEVSYIAMALMLSGIWFNSYPRLRGQYLVLSADVVWAGYALYNQQWALLLQSIVLFFIALRAIRSWSRQGIQI